MQLHNKAFQYVFSKSFVYNILFEDTELDEQFLEVDETSSVLSITGAGCGVAGLISARPERVDAVDINKHHLSLTALKVAAAQHLFPYSHFYDMFGRGWHHEPAQTIRKLLPHLPKPMQKHWKKRTDMFERSFYRQGLTARTLGLIRKMGKLDGDWLRSLIELDQEARMAAVEERIGPLLRNPVVATYMKSPMQLVTLGINFEQRDRLLNAEKSTLTDFFVEHVRRVASTDLATNWFAWQFIAGEYNHERQDAVPPYLRKDRYERSYQAPTKVNFHHGNIFDKLEAAGPKTWSHYTLCDAPDWMPQPLQKRLLNEILRTSHDGGVVLCRSVEDESMIEKNGMEKHFQLYKEGSDEDRSKQYRRVDFYRIVH